MRRKLNEFVWILEMLGWVALIAALLVVFIWTIPGRAQSSSLPPQCGGASSLPDATGTNFITNLNNALFGCSPIAPQMTTASGSINGTFNLTSRPFSAVGNAQMKADGAISSGSHSFSSASANFQLSDTGKAILVRGAGTSGAILQTTITARTSSTQVTLSASASTTVSGAAFVWGTDNRSAIAAAIGAGESISWAAPGNYLVSCPASGNPAINLNVYGASIFGASGHGGTDVGQLPSVQILGSGCPIVEVNANGVAIEGVGIRDPLGNGSTVALQIGTSSLSSPLSTFTIAGDSIFCQRAGGVKCYLGTGISTHFALRGAFLDNVIEDWGTGIILGSGNRPGSTESNANVLTGNKIRENVVGLQVPSSAAPDIFSFGNTYEGNLIGADLEGDAVFKDFGSHFENGNNSIGVTAPTVCGGATVAPAEIVNCNGSVEASKTGFYGVISSSPITSLYNTSVTNSKLEGGPVGPIISGAGDVVLQDLTAGPSNVSPIGGSSGLVIFETGLQTTQLQGGSVFQFRGYSYIDTTFQDLHGRTIAAIAGGSDPNNGAFCTGANLSHCLNYGISTGSTFFLTDPLYVNFAPSFAGEVNVEGKCLGCASPAEVTSTQLQSQTSVLQGGGWKHQSVSTGSISASSAADVTLSWTSAFADTSYDPVCNVVGSAASNNDLRLHHIESVSAGSIVARVVNDDGSSAHSGTLVCTALHQ